MSHLSGPAVVGRSYRSRFGGIRTAVVIAAMLGMGATTLAGCSGDSDGAGPTLSSSSSTSLPPSTTAAPSPEPSETSPDPTSVPTGELTAENFAATVGAAVVAKGSVHQESTTVQGGVISTTISADYVLITDDAGGLFITMPVPPDGQMQLSISPEGSFVNLGEESDNKYYPIDPADDSNPIVAVVRPVFLMLDIGYNIDALNGDIGSFAAVGAPVDIDGVLAQEYSFTAPSTAVHYQLGAESADNLPESIEFHYWISPENLPVKITYEVNGSTNETLLTQWGEIAPITAPSPDQILTDSPS